MRVPAGKVEWRNSGLVSYNSRISSARLITGLPGANTVIRIVWMLTGLCYSNSVFIGVKPVTVCSDLR